MTGSQITASYEDLMRQACETAEKYMRYGRRSIDEEFGDGFAQAHPSLVAAFMQTAAADYAAAVSLKGAQERSTDLCTTISMAADALSEIGSSSDRIAAAIEEKSL